MSDRDGGVVKVDMSRIPGIYRGNQEQDGRKKFSQPFCSWFPEAEMLSIEALPRGHLLLPPIDRLWPAQDATASIVVPLLLDEVGMTVPGHISTCAGTGAKRIGAFIADFIAAAVIPGVEQGIGCRLHLFVRGLTDRQISSTIVGSGKARIAVKAGRVGHCRVDEGGGTVGGSAVVGAEKVGCTLSMSAIDAKILSSLCKNKEDRMEATYGGYVAADAAACGRAEDG